MCSVAKPLSSTILTKGSRQRLKVSEEGKHVSRCRGTKNIRNIQVLPVENADGHSQKTDYGVFCVSNTNSKNSTTGRNSNTQTKSSPPKDDSELGEKGDRVSKGKKVEVPKPLGVKRISEENVKTMLQQEGLITKLKGQSSKGMAFEIIEKQREDVAPPARLDQMIKLKEKRAEPTVDEIKQKLFEAERRRKQLADERIVRVRAMKKTETASAIKAFEQKQKALEDQQTRKMDDAVASRQDHLRDIRDKLRAKRKHAQLVRQRKDLNLDDMDPPPPP